MTQIVDAGKLDRPSDHTSSADNQSFSIKDRFNQLSTQKQFALISLTALGTSMLITGRSVRAIMKRANAKSLESTESNKIKIKEGIIHDGDESINHIEVKMNTKKMDRLKFWDNRSLPCVKDRLDMNHGDLKFNPALDAMGAFAVATSLVLGTTILTIKLLSDRWELNGFEDWRIFIQSGYLAKDVIPKHLSTSISNCIPNQLKTSQPVDLSQSNTSVNSSKSLLNDFIQTFDDEWEIEKNRRDTERSNWENQRKVQGKKIWSD